MNVSTVLDHKLTSNNIPNEKINYNRYELNAKKCKMFTTRTLKKNGKCEAWL